MYGSDEEREQERMEEQVRLHERELERLHQTFLEYLILNGQPTLAAAALEGGIDYMYDERGLCGVYLDLPPAGYTFIAKDPDHQQAARLALRSVISGHLHPGRKPDEFDMEFRMNLCSATDGWRDVVRDMIVNYKGSNQALVTEIMAARDRRPVHTYNELKYASKSEIKIAMELERRKVLFFPLAVGVRAETGVPWQDHREADFLICNDGVWGILEVAWHAPERYEKDSEKAVWLGVVAPASGKHEGNR